ncbi:extensin isoform X2 [Drosophila grimshawi]|uniref:extensin isoform X2 n=1 Tax=Drosophila grimshawi TaxID=7222 RepID=UPI000C871655|nr:extensin isoform X2 [Drosophila grimshawi]
MVNYLHHLQQLLLLLFLLGMLEIGLAHEDHQSDTLHRSKRTLTTICVEIKPSGPQEEPYFMCRGTDFSRGNNAATATATATADQPQPIPYYAQPAGQAMPINVQYASVPFPSFPSFGAGFLPILPSYEEAPKASPYQSQTPAVETQFGSTAAAIAPAPVAQSYGLPAVPYPAAAGPAAANRGTAVGPSAAPAPPPYADAPPPNPTAAAHKSQPASSKGQSYDALVGSRYRAAPGDDVMNMPDLGFRLEELQRRPMEPMVGAAPPMTWTRRPQQLPVQYEDDPVMRTFYASQEHYDPQMAQAVPMEQLVGQAAPAYPPAYAVAPPIPGVVAPPPSQPPVPPVPAYTENSKATTAPDGNNACNSCNRPCSTSDSYNAVPAHCPSFQPVIIAMPCYGQQQPTHYLAVPGSGAPAPQREQMLGSAFGAPPFGMATPGLGSPFGMSPHFGMPSPQVGSSFGMAPQVGAPFGMAPVLNPFGPFGNLNPFNPFNRILGAAAPTAQQPRMRLFGAPQEATTATTHFSTTYKNQHGAK